MPSVRVPQADGDITVRVGTAEPQTWSVDDHLVSVKTADLDAFLRYVDGAKVQQPPSATKSKSESPAKTPAQG